jgi:hypothetical protein
MRKMQIADYRSVGAATAVFTALGLIFDVRASRRNDEAARLVFTFKWEIGGPSEPFPMNHPNWLYSTQIYGRSV